MQMSDHDKYVQVRAKHSNVQYATVYATTGRQCNEDQHCHCWSALTETCVIPHNFLTSPTQVDRLSRNVTGLAVLVLTWVAMAVVAATSCCCIPLHLTAGPL